MKKMFVVLLFLVISGVYAQQGVSSVPMVRVNGGTFRMGALATEPERDAVIEAPQGDVTVNAFYIGKYEVTQKEYEEVTGTNPSPASGRGDNLPVVNVSWYDAIEYCNLLSQREGLTPAYTIDKDRKDTNSRNDKDDVQWTVTWNRNANGYRLPTEAEWEYACRAGTNTYFSAGNNISTDQANYDGRKPYNNNAEGEFRGKATTVGSFTANPWGLFDMHGNVWEWCWDWFDNSRRPGNNGSYPSGARTDPLGANAGVGRILRGGSWFDGGNSIRSAFRSYEYPSRRAIHIGFRVVRP